jgi:hypothetical protein
VDFDDLEHAAIELHRRAGCDPSRPAGGAALARVLLGPSALTIVPHAGLAGRAQLRPANDGVRIALPSRLRGPDLNFAVCHEIAEHELQRACVGAEHIERMANAYAACIAAPAPSVRLAFYALRWNLPRLARAFLLSETAVALRIGEVIAEPVAVVRAITVDRRGPDALPSDDALRAVVRARLPGVLKGLRAREIAGLEAHEISDARRRAVVAVAG